MLADWVIDRPALKVLCGGHIKTQRKAFYDEFGQSIEWATAYAVFRVVRRLSKRRMIHDWKFLLSLETEAAVLARRSLPRRRYQLRSPKYSVVINV
jgi:hypothetical protein